MPKVLPQRLSDLDPQLLRVTAQGIRFECPKCGNHQVLVWFANRDVPVEEEPLPRWNAEGTGLEDLTITPSINVRGWHGFVRKGSIR